MANVLVTVVYGGPTACWEIPDEHQTEFRKFLAQKATALDAACDEFTRDRLPDSIAALKREALD